MFTYDAAGAAKEFPMRRFMLSGCAVVLGLAAAGRGAAQTPSTQVAFPPSQRFGLAAKELGKLGTGGTSVTPLPIPKNTPVRPTPAKATPVAKAAIDPSAIIKKRGAAILAKPDLVVAELAVNGSQARVTVENRGNAPASTNRLNLQGFRDGALFESLFVTVPALAPGGSTTLTLNASPRVLDIAGTSLVVKVDDGRVIEESDETNNLRTRVMPITVAADLIVNKVEFILGGSEVRIEVKNVGGTEAPAFRVRREFFKDGEERGIATLQVERLAAGGTRSVSFSAGSANPVDLMVVTLDDLNQVREAKESNNRFTKVLR
jgi:hypothetical protein